MNSHEFGLAVEMWANEHIEERLKDALACWFCKRRCDEMFPPATGGFNSFERLAQHVSYCPDAPVPRGAGDDLEFCAARILAANMVADARMRGETSMALPKPSDNGGTPATGGGRPQPFPFLKVDDVPKGDNEATILAIDTNGTGFNDLVLKIKFLEKTFFFGLKTTSPVYKILYAKLGEDEENWPGALFTIFPEWNKFYEKNFIGAKDVQPAKPKQAAKR